MPQAYYEYSNTFLEDDIAYATDIATEFSAVETGLDALWADVPATVQTYVDAATTQATNAAASATAAALSEDVALAASNYAGIWADLVGALNVPASVYHGGGFWMLNSNLADVTTKEPGVDPEWTLIQRPDFTMTASGSITAGDPLILNSNGTVSVVSGTAFAAGNAATFESATTSHISACYDTANDRVVVVYVDGGNSSYGTACVGTVTGTSISWGTPVVFKSATTSYTRCCFDSTNNKVVVTYVHGSNGVRAVVGTVSGTSITFGAEASISSSSATYDQRCSFNSSAGKVVVFYLNSDETTRYIVVGTVSGTTISFGAAASIASGLSNANPRMAYDPDANRNVILYQNNVSPAYLELRHVSVSGTTPTISAVIYAPVATTQTSHFDIVYDTLKDCFVIVWFDANIDYGYSVWMCTAKWNSGRSHYVLSDPVRIGSYLNFYYPRLAFHSSTNSIILSVVDTQQSTYPLAYTYKVNDVNIETNAESNVAVSAAINSYIELVSDPDSNNIIELYGAVADGYGKAVVFTPETSTASEKNFIGFARTSAATTESVIVDGLGNINISQTGLTTGSMYFLDYDGSLTTSDTGIPAGRALSATSIQVGAAL